MDWKICIFLLFYVIYSVQGGRPVYVSNGSHILSYSKDDARVTVVYGKNGFSILGLAVDFGNNFLFWSDTSAEFKGIYRSNLEGKNVTTIVKDVQEVSDLGVDWVSNHIYWADTKAKSIEIANYDGSSRKVLISRDLRGPRNIAVDPISGYVFWADQRAKRIERSWLDGSHRRTIVKSKKYWPNQLAVNSEQKKLYWVDARNHAIFSCSFKGSNVKEQRGLKSITKGAPAYGLVVFGNTAVISTWFSTALYSVLIGAESTVWQLEARDLGTRELYSLISLNPATQPSRDHPCSDAKASGCSHLCLPSRGQEFTCSCPTYGGLSLARDGKTCQIPNQMLFVSLQQYGEVGFLSIDAPADAGFSLVSRSTKPAAVTFDPINQVVYWSDLSEKCIYSVHLDGTHRRMVLNSSHGVGTVQGMAFDWSSGRLYFTNVGHSGPSLDGTVYSWHRVEFVEVNTRKRKTILHELGNPIALALDLNERYMYISEGGKHPKIIQTELDGKHQTTISKNRVPTGIAVAGDQLHFAGVEGETENDTTFKLMTYDTIDDEVYDTISIDEIPVAFSASQDAVFYINPYKNQLVSYNGTERHEILSEGKPYSLAYSVSSVKYDETENECYNTGCDGGCVLLPWDKLSVFRCLCYDGTAEVLQQDEKTCKRPRNFLLYADMTTINMISLDSGTEAKPVVLHHGDINSNFVALTYDDVKDRVYWSDHTSQAIYLSDLIDVSPVLLYKEEGFVEGLVIDPTKQRLYWTVVTSQTGSGFIARLNIDRGLGSYKRLQTSRNNPRAITLHPSGRWIYWTEHKSGATGVEVFSCKNNGQRYRKLLSVDLHWPNSLVVSDNKLYIGDGRGKIIATDIEGDNLQVISDDTSTISHVFGLAVLDNTLLYSDWDTNTITMMDMGSDFRTSLVSNLTRPTAIVLYQPDTLDGHVCFTEENPCSDNCRPLPRGLHKCMCEGERHLAEDGATCFEDVSTTTSTTTPYSTMAETLENTEETTEPGFPYEEIGNETVLELPDNDVVMTKMPMATENHDVVTEFVVEKDNVNNEISTDEKSEVGQEENDREMKDITDENVQKVEDKDDDTNKDRTVDLDNVTEGEIGITSVVSEVKEIVTSSEVFGMDKEVKIGAAFDKMIKETLGDNSQNNDTIPKVKDESVRLTPNYDKKTVEMTPISVYKYDNKNIETTPEPGYSDDWMWKAVDEPESESVVELGVKLEPIGLPYFETCSSEETIILSLPSSSSHVTYPMIPRAYDSTGTPLTVSSSQELNEEGIRLGWEGEGEECYHKVMLWAVDGQGQEVACEIKVVLQDVDPPVFTFCPGKVKVSTVREMETVHWSVPVASDNVGVAILNGSHVSGSSFPLGLSVVNYTATDWAGNQAICSFLVVVSEEIQCQLPDIQHGGIVCNQGDENEGECSVVCDPDYVVNPIRIFRRAFNCKHPDELEAMATAMKTQSPCLLRRYPSIIQKEFHLQFTGPVLRHKPEVLAYVSTSVSDYLVEKKLCDGKACTIGNMTVYCGFGKECIEEEEQEKFYTVFNITMTNSSTTNGPDMLTVLEKIHQELVYLSSALGLQIEEHRYEAVASAVTARQHTWSCSKGQIYEKSCCIACPVGTYHNMSIDVCQFCNKGSYQDKEGQLYCRMCNPGQTSADGATHETQCTAIPSMDEMTLFIIVTACSFGVVFLCMAITLYLQFKRQQKRNEKHANQKKTRYNMSPNVYVAPPPILKSKLLDEDNASFASRTYSIDKKRPFNIYANHDYEDVDRHLSNIEPPIYQNGTFATSPANSLNFPSAESPSTDDLSMSTLSRENTLQRDNTFRNDTFPQFGVRRSQKASGSSSPGPQRKMSRDSTFSGNSPRMMRAQRTPSNDGPFLTQSPLLRLKMAAYNFNQED